LAPLPVTDMLAEPRSKQQKHADRIYMQQRKKGPQVYFAPVVDAPNLPSIPDHLVPLRVALSHHRSQEISRILRTITDYKGAIREVLGFVHPTAVHLQRLDRGQQLRMIGEIFLTDLIIKWDRLLYIIDLIL
jgi:hypothetical protein